MKTKKYQLLIIAYLLSTLFLNAQQVYYCSTNTFSNTEIGIIDIGNNCDTTILADVNVVLRDISFDADGNFYGCSLDSLYIIDLESGDIENLGALPGGGYQGLTCSNEGILYAIGTTSFCSYKITSSLFEYLGSPPSPELALPLGLSFKRCKLLANVAVGFFNDEIFEICPGDITKSMLIHQDSTPFSSTRSITTISMDCDSTLTLLAELDGFTAVIRIYKLNSANYNFIELCELPPINYLNITGLASPSEPLQPSFRPILDLDINNSSGLFDADFQAPPDCNNIFPIADIDVSIDICHGVDSVRAWLISGVADGNAELLSAAETANIAVQGDQSATLLLINNGDANNNDFSNILSSGFYNNNATDVTSGIRQIAMVGYCGYFAGDTAYTYITVQETVYAGENGQVSLCPDDDIINLMDYLSGTPSANGEWQPNTVNDNGEFDPTLDEEGSYYYIVGEAGCPMDTAEVMVTLLETPFFSFDGTTWLCEGDNILLGSPITGASYQWQDGNSQSSYLATNPGLYWLEVSNSDGCIWRDSIVVMEGLSYHATEAAAICSGESYIFEEILFTSDTFFCVTYTTLNACDSILCLELTVANNLVSETNITLCEGDDYLFSGTNYSETGYYVDTLFSFNGCDSLVALALDFSSSPVLQLDSFQQLPESGVLHLDVGGTYSTYYWSTGETSQNISINAADSYSLTVSDENGCTASTEITVTDFPSYYLPTAFSPNADGINDYFTAYPGASIASFELLRVYNRWGEKVFEVSPLDTTIESRGWDGHFRNQPCPNGVYLFWLEVRYMDGRRERKMGDFLLVR